jgi:predicted CopG family antitoxin
MYTKEKMVTIKVTEADHEKLRRIKHERFVESYPDVISVLLKEYENRHPEEAPA